MQKFIDALKNIVLRNQIVFGFTFALLLITGYYLYSHNARLILVLLVLCAIGFLMLCFRFPIIPMLLIAFIVPANLVYFFPSTAAPLLILGLFVVVIKKLLSGSLSFNYTSFMLCLIALFTWQVAAIVWSLTYDKIEISVFLRTLAIVLLVTWTVTKPSHYVAVILCSVLGVVFSTGTALHEMISFFRFGLQTGSTDVFRDVEKARFFGAWTDPNIMGLSAVPFVVLSYAVIRTKFNFFVRLLAALSAIIGCIGILVSMSRGAILALLIAIIVIFIAEKKRFILLCGLIISVWLVLLLTPLDLLGRITSLHGGDASVSQRSELIAAGLEMAYDFLPFGAGTGNSGIYSPDYSLSLRHGVVLHNAFLDILVDNGIIGLVLFLAAFASVIPQFRIKRWRFENEIFGNNLTICMMGAFLSVLLANVVASYASYSLVWYVIALISVHRTVFKTEKSNQYTP